jgi:hypothetical protein
MMKALSKWTRLSFYSSIVCKLSECVFYFSSNNCDNFIEILKWSAKTDPLARAILEESAGNATYLSNRI